MKIRRFLLIVIIILISLGGVYFYYAQHNKVALPSFISKHTTSRKYIIKKAGRVINSADTLDDAIEKAKGIKRSIAINTYNNEWVYSDFSPYMIITKNAVHDFTDLKEAIQYAKENEYTKIYYKSNMQVIWQSEYDSLKGIRLNVPLINQNPELPRGCEVTSLAMIMKYAGIDANKMTLAKSIKKESSIYQKQNGRIRCGNPYDGFVGDMYNINNFGYGVYHGPIVELANEYSDAATDLTGLEFEDVLTVVEAGYPAWIITNGTYNILDDSQFEIWHTPTGIVKITYRLHSVVITGFDQDYIYINDPLSSLKNKKLSRQAFKEAWEQMGNQAIVIID